MDNLFKLCDLTPNHLFLDHATGNAVSSVPRRIGLHIVRLGMNHQGGATITEQRVAVVPQGDIFVQHFELGAALRVHREIVHIAGMVAFGILQAMLFSIGIEMRAG